jgi:predicted AlkP superfamily pyrophosphatase or phosphodiesterase
MPEKPALVLGIVVDQFRYDYLLRFRADYKEGLDRLLTKGAVFADANYDQVPTVTGVGHSIFLSGAPPSVSGIVGNEWFDYETGKRVTCVSDSSTRIIGAPGGEGSSPRNLLVSTVGDELKIATQGRSRVVGISLKDRAAILPSGHMADGAFWFDSKTGNFVSSSYYFKEIPEWVRRFNGERNPDRYKGEHFLTASLSQEPGEKLYGSLQVSPFGNELVELFAERAISEEKLGQRGVTDLMTVSFSSNDYVGHEKGPDSAEVREISIRTDRTLGKLFHFLDARIGLERVLIVFTADHGVGPVPEENERRKMPGGRIPLSKTMETAQNALSRKYGPGNWVAVQVENALYLNRTLLREKNLSDAEAQQIAAEAVATIPHVARAYTGAQLSAGNAEWDPVSRRIMNGYNPRRSGDVYVLLEPYWIFGTIPTTHGSPYVYDSHIPLIFAGPNIRAGNYYRSVVSLDIAPTISNLLGIEFPSGSTGRILSEMFAGLQH